MNPSARAVDAAAISSPTAINTILNLFTLSLLLTSIARDDAVASAHDVIIARLTALESRPAKPRATRAPGEGGSADELGDDRKMIRRGDGVVVIDGVAAGDTVGERLRHEHVIEPDVRIPRRQRVAGRQRMMRSVRVDVSGADDRLDRAP